MSTSTRQQLYDRIRESSKDEVILEEMIQLGFWPSNQEKPGLPEQAIRRQGELERELKELLAKQKLYQDPERALKALRKQRMKEAREKREQTKQRREQQRLEKAQVWQQRQQREVLYLGEEVSTTLNDSASDTQRLARYDLPVFHNAAEIADAMGISLAELRFLTFHRKVSRVSHYQRFSIAKKTGGTRSISAPMPRLKRAQYWLLDNVLNKVPVHDAAHGFLTQRSIVSNAREHLGQDVVINHDIKDFFPSVHYPRIKGLFKSLGYSGQAATIFALLASEAEVDEVELDGETFFIAKTQRILPQGAPTSPMITNLLCRRLDARLAGTAKKLGFNYSRYADDMSFSGSGDAARKVRKLLWRVEQIVTAEGFTLHPDKLRVMRHNRRQEVTGLVVNEKPAINRKTLRQFRALLQQIELNGPAGKHWGNSDDVLAAIHGFAHYVAMVDSPKGKALLVQVKRIHEQLNYRLTSIQPSALNNTILRTKAAAGNAPRETWWPTPPTQTSAPPQPEEHAQKNNPDQSPSTNIDSPTEHRIPKKRRFSWWRFIIKIIIIVVLIQLSLRLLGRLL